MVDLNCTGAEKDVSACQSTGWGSHNCGQRDDVGVECRKSLIINQQYPLNLQFIDLYLYKKIPKVRMYKKLRKLSITI